MKFRFIEKSVAFKNSLNTTEEFEQDSIGKAGSSVSK